jgi:hypothetical protein
MFVDCRDYPSEMNCTVAISAENDPVLKAAGVAHTVEHAFLFPGKYQPMRAIGRRRSSMGPRK